MTFSLPLHRRRDYLPLRTPPRFPFFFYPFIVTLNVVEHPYPSPDRHLSTSEILYVLCKLFAEHGVGGQTNPRRREDNPTETSSLSLSGG